MRNRGVGLIDFNGKPDGASILSWFKCILPFAFCALVLCAFADASIDHGVERGAATPTTDVDLFVGTGHGPGPIPLATTESISFLVSRCRSAWCRLAPIPKNMGSGTTTGKIRLRISA